MTADRPAPRRSTLPATRADGLPARPTPRQAALYTARPTAAAVLLGAGHLPFWFFYWIKGGLYPALAAALPATVVRPAGLSLMLLLPLLGAWVVTRLVRGRVREAAARSREAGEAAAAGVGMAAIGTGAVVVAVDQLLVRPSLWNLGLWAVGGLFGLGLVGAGVFREVAAVRGDGRVPALYPAVLAAGLAGPMLGAAVAAFAWVSWSVPALSPLSIGLRLGLEFSAFWAFRLAAFAIVTAPAAGLAAALVRRLFPGASRRGLATGAATPAVLLGLVTLARVGGGPVFEAGAAAVTLLAALTHGASAWAGAGRARRVGELGTGPGAADPALTDAPQ